MRVLGLQLYAQRIQMLGRTTECVYISCDVVFDEHHFPFASSVGDRGLSPNLSPTIFPSSELVIQDDRMRNYDLTLLHGNDAATSGSSASAAPPGAIGGSMSPTISTTRSVTPDTSPCSIIDLNNSPPALAASSSTPTRTAPSLSPAPTSTPVAAPPCHLCKLTSTTTSPFQSSSLRHGSV